MPPRDLERAVGRARVDDQQLDLAIDALRADGAQAPRPGTRAPFSTGTATVTMPLIRSAGGWREHPASSPRKLAHEPLRRAQRPGQLPRGRGDDLLVQEAVVLLLALLGLQPVQLLPEPVALGVGLLQRGLGGERPLLEVARAFSVATRAPRRCPGSKRLEHPNAAERRSGRKSASGTSSLAPPPIASAAVAADGSTNQCRACWIPTESGLNMIAVRIRSGTNSIV